MPPNAYKPKDPIDVSYLVNARQKTYRGTTEIYIPKQPYKKIEEGYEPRTKIKKRTSSTPSTLVSEEDILQRSRRRTYTAVKDIALSNIFELFATFSFGKDRFDDEKSRRKMIDWLKRQRKYDKSFQYLIVSEFHKKCEECVINKSPACSHDDRPKALHFHALMNAYKGPIVRAIDPRTGLDLVKRHRKVYDFPNFTLGWSEVYFIGDTEKDRIRSSFYLLKYLKKDMTTFKSKKRYWASRGLKQPLVIENPKEWYRDITPDHSVLAAHGEYLFFDNDKVQSLLV